MRRPCSISLSFSSQSLARFLLSLAASVVRAFINTEMAAKELVYNIFSDLTVKATSEYIAAGEVDLFVMAITWIPRIFADFASSIVSDEYGGNENTISTPFVEIKRDSS